MYSQELKNVFTFEQELEPPIFKRAFKLNFWVNISIQRKKFCFKTKKLSIFLEYYWAPIWGWEFALTQNSINHVDIMGSKWLHFLDDSLNCILVQTSGSTNLRRPIWWQSIWKFWQCGQDVASQLRLILVIVN